MDIRRYFVSPDAKNKPSAHVAKKESPSSTTATAKAPSSKTGTQSRHKQAPVVCEVKSKTLSRKRTVVIESDDDEEPIPTKKPSTRLERMRLLIEDSDDDEEVFPNRKQQEEDARRPPKRNRALPTKTSKPSSPKKLMNLLTADEFFGDAAVKRASRTNKLADNKNENDRSHGFEIHDDIEFIETLKAMDAETQKPMKTVNEKPARESVTFPAKEKSPKKTPRKSTKPLVEIHREPSSTQVKEVATPDATSSAEKRRGNYQAYMQYKHRDGPKSLGSKEIPEGSENCMEGLHFVVTGVLESIEREHAVDLIKKYGGKVQSSICKSTDYVVVGRDAGPSKIEKAEKMRTKQISEDDFLDLIRTLPSKSHSRTRSTGKKPSAASIEKGTPAKVDIAESKTTKANQLQPRSLDMMEVTPAPSSTKCAVIQAVPKVSPSSSFEGSSVNNSDQMWVDKYKPKTTKQVIGQNGDKSNVKKLTHWLSKWHHNHLGKLKKKAFAGKWNSDDGSGCKAALLSGPPGVGKTTSAQLVCKELGFTYVELNASDTRSKRSLQEVVAELLRNKSLTHYVMGNPNDAGKHCLLMDEVDGMAGNEDRGGVQELIQLIKNSKVPVICMCNDRNHQKIRSLANHCFDLRFHKPRVEQLKGALMSICFKEGIEISSDALQEIIIGANQDVRQILHHLSMWSVKSKTFSVEEAKADARKSKKDLKMGPFDVLRSVFSESEQKAMSIHDKSDLFFHDYSLAPLFVFENYLSVVPHTPPQDAVTRLQLTSRAADSICKGDLIEKLIRSEGHWSLLPVEAMFASVIPGDVLAGHIGQMINFPSWLGRNSSRAKTDRILQELHMHTRLRTSGSKTDLNADYLQSIREAVVRPLVADGQDGAADAVAVMNEYNLLREDLDSILDVNLWPDQPNPYAKLSSQVKAAFTRTYNKMAHTNPYAAIGATSKNRKAANDNDIAGDSFDADAAVVDEESAVEVDDDVTKDAMIKTQTSKRKFKTKLAQSSKNGPARKKGKS